MTDVIPVNGYSEDQVLSISAAIESRSEHPLGEAILSYARQKGWISLQEAASKRFGAWGP